MQYIPTSANNDACFKWCHNMATKGNQHIEMQENSVRKWVADGTLTVLHVSSKTNIAGIFTKEMRDSAKFCSLRNALMCRAGNYNKHFHSSHNVPSSIAAQTAHYITPSHPGLLEVLASHFSFCLPDTISCLSASGLASGRYLLSCITYSSPLQAPMSNTMGGGST